MTRVLALWLLLITGSWYLLPAQAARTFADGEYLEVQSAVAAVPLTMCTWARAPTIGLTMEVMAIATLGADDHTLSLTIQSSNEIQARARAVFPTVGVATSTTALTANTWVHICGVFASSTSRSIYVNGAGKVTNTDSATPAGMNRTYIAKGVGGSGGREWNGPLGEATVWNVALTDAEVAAAMVRASRVRPSALVACVPVWGQQSPEIDTCAARTWLLTGTGAVSTTNPPIGLFSQGR